MATTCRPIAGLSKLYRELDVTSREIRLLSLQPGQQYEDIHGFFEYAFLAEPTVPYETVSYVWGDPLKRGSMYLSGQVLDIPESAETVLRRVRHAIKTRLLWIDSICINQKMQREREAQVVIMHAIYSGGKKNLIWLGPASENTPAALQSITSLASELRNITKDFTDIASIVDYKSIVPASPFTSIINHSATVEFYQSQWFRRVWVLQEACLSPRSICFNGPYEIPLIDVLRAACMLGRGSPFLPPAWSHGPHLPAHAMILLVDGVIQPSVPRRGSILSTLLSLQGVGCTDPRDRVYGIVGVYQKLSKSLELPQALLPDYSAPVERVWKSAVNQAVVEMNNLELLRGVSPFTENNRRASWVPDLSGRAALWNPLPPLFSADDQAPMQLRGVDHHSDVLTVGGFIVDYVRQTRPGLWQKPKMDYTASDLRDEINRMEELVTDSNASMPVEITPLAVTIQAGTDRFLRFGDRRQMASAYTRFKDYLATHDNVPGVATPESNDEPQNYHFIRNVVVWCRHRAIFRTNSGYLGLGVEKMRVGDVIAILFGRRYPVILRPLSDVDSRYTFIGVTYVDGIMSGELAKEHKASGRPDVIFDLQ